ncbi:Uncharacterized protein GBIM_13901, partial [Gryllus bimaculatus]
MTIAPPELFEETARALEISAAAPRILCPASTAGARAANWPYIAPRKVLNTSSSCATRDAAACLGAKAVSAVRRAARMDTLQLVDGVAFVRTGEDAPAPEGEGEGEAEVRRSLEAAGGASLFDLLMDAVGRFFHSHSLQLSMPQGAPELLQRALDEGRGKKKMLKQLLPILLAAGAKLLLVVPLGIGLLGLVATKALLVSKLALLLAGGLALQKLLGGGGLGGLGLGGKGGASAGWSAGAAPAAGWSAGGGGGGYSSGPAASSGWSRSLDAHELAYAGQQPASAPAPA